MRKIAATILILGAVWIGYTAWPIYDLLVLVRAIETHDVDTVTRHVYFDAVRISLTNQVVDAYVRRTGIQIGPLRRNMAAAAIANPVVEKLISREALSQLLTIGWPVTVVPDGSPPGTIGITTNTIGTIWQIFSNSHYGIGRFEVSAPACCRRCSGSVSRFGYCSGAGNSPRSSSRKPFKTYLEMSSSKPRERGEGCSALFPRALSRSRKCRTKNAKRQER
jgi:hypothetical protein